MKVSLQLLCVRSSGHKVNAKQKGQAGCPGCPFGEHQCANYLAMVVVLPKRLRNFSTRPPMLSTDFCVPV